jgi:hypothetical protein
MDVIRGGDVDVAVVMEHEERCALQLGDEDHSQTQLSEGMRRSCEEDGRNTLRPAARRREVRSKDA